MKRPDILIVGSGMIGLAAGVALARDHFRVTLLEAGEEPQPFDASSDYGLRVSAIAPASSKLLQAALPLSWQTLPSVFSSVFHHSLIRVATTPE